MVRWIARLAPVMRVVEDDDVATRFHSLAAETKPADTTEAFDLCDVLAGENRQTFVHFGPPCLPAL